MTMQPILEEHEAFSDEELMKQLDEPHKWEIRTDDAVFDTHYHTLREALSFAAEMNERAAPMNAISKLDGTILIEREQVLRLLRGMGLPLPIDPDMPPTKHPASQI